MGTLIQGKWEVNPVNSSVKDGEFKRQVSSFRDKISSDSRFKPEQGRYHLYVSYACPWAHRTLITRTLKGLEDFIDVSIVSPKMGDQGWSFIDKYTGATSDPINGAEHIKDLYTKADPSVNGKATVPVLWDKQEGKIVNNESADIIRIFNNNLNNFAKNPELDLVPQELENEINELNKFIYSKINNGVYKSGFATTQEAYTRNVIALFDALDEIEIRLENKKFLFGDNLTEADIRLFTTLIRFDLVYFAHFKCNIKMIKDYKNLYRYTKEIYEIPAVKTTVNFDHIKTHYYWSQESINPTKIVPVGPNESF